MNEAAASQVLLLRAYESTGFDGWSDDDRAWASRSALQSVGEGAAADTFLAARAQAALTRLAPRDPLLARWQPVASWQGAWSVALALAAFAAGLLVDRIGSAQRINLLAPPVWALLAWNLAVYLLLLAGCLRRPAAPGALRRAVADAWSRWRARALQRGAGASAGVWQAFAADWAACSAPLQAARIALALHLAAAALGLGLVAGMYLRGLVLDYRVGWQSTFLDAASVHAVLATLLAPASALSGIAVPDVAGVQALRLPQAEGADASAAPWIHLYALQLLLLVLLPRLLLALRAALRARALRQRLPLPLHEPYFQRLLRHARGGPQRVQVWPHARAPDAAAAARLRLLLQRVQGEGLSFELMPVVPYGGEDAPRTPEGGASRAVLCDLGATPEPESQGRLLRALGAPAAAPLLLLDEAAFVRRFGAASPRVAERRQAWRDFAAALGSSAVCIDLQSADLAPAEAALQAALDASPGVAREAAAP